MNQIRIFRILSLAEGISLLTLLFLAMPMKYFMNIPEAVKIVGSIHGGLFVLYVVALAILHFTQRWPFLFSLGALVASFIPFGTFVLDRHLRRKEVAAN
jgi:integral membrane protein